MTWSIYKDTTGRSVRDWEECHTAWFVDQDIITNHYPNRIKFLHDGYHEVYFDSNMITCRVVDGRWAPETHRDILEMVGKTYWGEFIEGFERRDGKLHVLIGS